MCLIQLVTLSGRKVISIPQISPQDLQCLSTYSIQAETELKGLLHDHLKLCY